MAYLSHTLAVKDQFSATLGRAASEIETLKKSEEDLQRANVLLAAGWGVLAAAATAFAGAAVAAFSSVEARLRELEVVTTTTNQNIQQALQQSLDRAQAFSNNFVFSMDEIIGASFELASAGLNVEQTIAGVEQAGYLAAAGLGDLRETAILLGSELNTVGQAAELRFLSPLEKAKKIADSTALAVKKFQITLPVLAEGLKFAVGPAAQLGVSLDELNATLGTLNTLGLRGSIAGNVLTNIFAKMSEATQKLGLDTSKFIDEAGNITSIADFLDAVKAALPTSPFERFSKLIEVFGIRAARGVVALVDQADALRQNTEELRRGAGSAEKFGNTVASSLSGQLKIAGNALQNFFVVIGQKLTPTLKIVAGVVASFARFLNNLPAPVIKLIAAFTLALAVFAAFKAAVLVASIVLSALTGAQVAATASAVAQAVAQAALAAAMGDLSAIVRVTTVLAIGTAAAYAFLADETTNLATNLNFANTQLEAISETITRTASDATLLGNAIEDIPTALSSIGGKEVNAFASLFDPRGVRTAESQLRGELDNIVNDLADAKPLSNFLSFEDPLGIVKSLAGAFAGAIPSINDFTDKTLGVGKVLTDLPGKEAERRLDALRKPVEEGSIEFLRLRAAIVALNETDIAERRLQVFSQQLARVSGADPAALFTQLRAEVASFGEDLSATDEFLAIFQRRFDAAFKRSGITLPVGAVENFTANVDSVDKALTALRDNKIDFSQLVTFQPRVAGTIESTFQFLQNNLAEIEKSRAGAVLADQFRGVLREAGQLKKLGSLNFKDVGTLFSDKAQEQIAGIILQLKDQLGGAIRSAANEALFLKFQLTQAALIDTKLVAPADRLAKTLEVVAKRAQAVNESFGTTTLARQSIILREQLRLYDEATKKNDALVASLESQLKEASLTASQRKDANNALDTAVKRQAELLDKTKATREALAAAQQNIAVQAQLFLPPGSALQKQVDDATKGVGGKFSFELAADAKAKIQRDIADIDGQIKKLSSTKAQVELFLAIDKKGVEQGVLPKTVVDHDRAKIKEIDDQLSALTEKRHQLQIDVARVDPAKFVNAVDNQLASQLATIGVKVGDIDFAAGAANFKKQVGDAFAEGLKTGNLGDFSATIGNKIRADLIKGASEGLAQGLLQGVLRGAAIEPLANKLGQALAGGRQQEAAALLGAIQRQIVQVSQALEQGGIREKFAQLADTIRGVEQGVTTTTNGLINMNAASQKAAEPLVKDLARLATLLQTVGADAAEFVRQIIALKTGEGTVNGLNAATLTTEQRLQNALSLLQQMQRANVGGAPVQELQKVITSLNEQLISAKGNAAAVGSAVKGAAATPAPVNPAPVNAVGDQIKQAVSALQVPPETIQGFDAIEASANRIEASLRRSAAITFDPDPTNIQKFVDTLASIDTTELERVIQLLDKDVSLPAQLEDASDTFDDLLDKARELVTILAGATIGVDGTLSVGESAGGGLAVEFAGTTFQISGVEGGITDSQKDEILRLAGEQRDADLEQLRQQLDNLSVLVASGA